MKTLVIALISALISQTAISQEEPEQSEVEAKIDEIRKSIKIERSKLDEDHWAGQYYSGDGTGYNVSLDIAPQSGFAFHSYGCLGSYDHNYGKVEEKGAELYLTFAFENDAEDTFGPSTKYLLVNWGNRKYLIEPGKILDFVNKINAGIEPREQIHGSFLLRKDDYKRKVRGFPSLPDQYKPYLLRKPIKTKVVKVGEVKVENTAHGYRSKEATIYLDVGKRDGVLPGMRFYAYYPDNQFVYAKITNVENSSCTAVTEYMEEDDPTPEPGWRFSTKL